MDKINTIIVSLCAIITAMTPIVLAVIAARQKRSEDRLLSLHEEAVVKREEIKTTIDRMQKQMDTLISDNINLGPR